MENREWSYRFEPNKRAEELTLHEQVRYAQTEATDAVLARLEGEARVAEELMDTIYAAEGALRKIPSETVQAAYLAVRAKAATRGDI